MAQTARIAGPSSCGKSSIASLVWHPRSDLRLPLGSIDLVVGFWDQSASQPTEGRRRFQFSVSRLASASARSRFQWGMALDRPKRAEFQQATAGSSHFPTRSIQQAQLRRKERQCISKSSRCPLGREACYVIKGPQLKRNPSPSCF